MINRTSSLNNFEQSKEDKNLKRNIIILKTFIILISLALIIYFFLDNKRIDDLIKDLYQLILNNYNDLLFYVKVTNFFTNYFIFVFFFICGFCAWNIYKSFFHLFGYFIGVYVLYFMKLIFKKEPFLFNLNMNLEEKDFSDETIISLCEYTSEYEYPSFRATLVTYSFLSFITLLFKEKKLKNNKNCKIISLICFVILVFISNFSLIFLLQNSFSSILIGMLIGFVIYFFIFRFIKINYERSEQLIRILDIKIIFYFLINFAFFLGLYAIYLINKRNKTDKDNENIKKFNLLCRDVLDYNKDINLETFIKSLIFISNLIMIISIKMQRKLIYKSNSIFINKSFLVDEVMDQECLFSQIAQQETNKINRERLIKYFCKVLICIGFSLIAYLVFFVGDYFKKENYKVFAILCSIIPLNLLIFFVFLFGKPLFAKIGLEGSNDS